MWRYAFTAEEAFEIGTAIGIEWNDVDFDPADLADGMQVELEHGTELDERVNVTDDDLAATAQIAWAHLMEDPDYYLMLDAMEGEMDDVRTPELRKEGRAPRSRKSYMRMVEPGQKRDTAITPELKKYVTNYLKTIQAAIDKGRSADEAFKTKPDMSRLKPDEIINLIWENKHLGGWEVPKNSHDLFTAMEGVLQAAIYQAAVAWWGKQKTQPAVEKTDRDSTETVVTKKPTTNDDTATKVEKPAKAAHVIIAGVPYRILR